MYATRYTGLTLRVLLDELELLPKTKCYASTLIRQFPGRQVPCLEGPSVTKVSCPHIYLVTFHPVCCCRSHAINKETKYTRFFLILMRQFDSLAANQKLYHLTSDFQHLCGTYETI